MSIESVLVTGANRGIGLEIVRQLVKLPDPPRFVFATYRNRDTVQDLKKIRDASKDSQVLLIKMDVCQAKDVEAARKIVEDMVGVRGLTLLVNNAGAGDRLAFPHLTADNLRFHFNTNAVGPILVFQEMLPLLELAAKRKEGAANMSISRAAVINISSSIGSITDVMNPHLANIRDVVGYQTSKAALNMLMRVAAAQVHDRGILVVLVCPGWVKTDMGTDMADLEVQDSVETLLKTMATLDESHHASFIDRKGKVVNF